MVGNLAKEHEQTCRQNMKVIVHDEKLWREFLSLSEAAHQRELHQDPPIKWRPLYASVDGYEIRYGERKTQMRADIDDGEVARDDLFFMKGGKVVAQVVDYIATYRSIDGPTSFTCLPLYKDLILGEVDQ